MQCPSVEAARADGPLPGGSNLVVEVWLVTLPGVILRIIAIVVVIDGLGMLFRSFLGLVGIPLIHSLGLSELVDLASDETGEELFRKGVGDGLAWYQCVSCMVWSNSREEGQHVGRTLLALMVFEQLHALESSSTANELVGEFGLVVIATAAVDFLVSVLSVV